MNIDDINVFGSLSSQVTPGETGIITAALRLGQTAKRTTFVSSEPPNQLVARDVPFTAGGSESLQLDDFRTVADPNPFRDVDCQLFTFTRIYAILAFISASSAPALGVMSVDISIIPIFKAGDPSPATCLQAIGPTPGGSYWLQTDQLGYMTVTASSTKVNIIENTFFGGTIRIIVLGRAT